MTASAIAALLERVGSGRTSSTAYDTATLAALRTPDGAVALPSAVRWLQRHQHADGSWGANPYHAHDRIIGTVAAVIALADLDEGWADSARRRGVEFLLREGGSWSSAWPDTIGFELVMPTLIASARAKQAGVPTEPFAPISQLRDDKLALIPRTLLYDNQGNVAFSSEFLDDPDPGLRRKLKSDNGSYACSPSASAAAWAITADQDTWSYLADTVATAPDGGAPAIFPMDVFDRAWVLGPLSVAGLVDPAAAGAHLDYLEEAFGPDGAAASTVGPAPDADTSAMCLLVLDRLGRPVHDRLDTLLRYDTGAHFRCFAFERDPSLSANARVRHALGLAAGRYEAEIARIDRFLDQSRTEDGFWLDKWHLSPYYTSEVVVSGGLTRPWDWAPTIAWLLDSQQVDGSWGIEAGTREETAYAVKMLALLVPVEDPCTRNLAERALAAIARGVAFLQSAPVTAPAELWIAKAVYAPLNVIEAEVACAVSLGHRALGITN